MMSSFMAAPFKFAANMIPESLLGGAVGDVVEISQSAKFGERQRLVQPAGFVEGVVQKAVRQHAPVQAPPAVGQLVERRSAVSVHAMVPAGLIVQAIDGVHVIEESGL